MADDQTARAKAISQQQETILVLGVIRVVDQASVLVQKHGLSLLKGDAVFYKVGPSLARIPGKLYIAHNIILAIQKDRDTSPIC